MLKAALVGAWHVHFDQYASEFAARPDCRITALWDDDPQRGAACAAKYACPYVPDYDALLARPDVDAVIVCSATSQHTALIGQAAQAGKHIYTEKVLAFTSAEAQRLAAQIERNGVCFSISLPWLARDFIQAAKAAIGSGALGDITYARIRNCHNGAIAGWLPAHFYDPVTCGGGAMMDLGAHSMYLLDYFLGLPVSVTSVFTHVTGKAVEDNAVSLLTYAGGAVGSAETGFTAQNDPYRIELCGTKGTLLSGGPDAATVWNIDGTFRPVPLPAPLPKPIDQWVDAILHGGPVQGDLGAAVRLSRLMETAYLSQRSGQTVPLVK